MPMLHHRYLVAGSLLSLIACTTSETIHHQAGEVSDLNRACTKDDCPADLTCGAPGGESAAQCILDGCPSKGPGVEHGCPDYAFCYVFDGDEGHYCTRTCTSDAECHTINPSLVCRERTATEGFGLKICVLGS